METKQLIIIGFIAFILALTLIAYQYRDKIGALYRLYTLDEEIVNRYINSYEKLYSKKVKPQINTLADFENGVPLIGYKVDDQWESTEDLYNVLHDLCMVGGLTKMYVPPHLGKTTDIEENQLLMEKQMADLLNVKEGEHLLEIGCGCGAIAMEMHKNTKCKITGINIDDRTLEKGREILKNQKNNDIELIYGDLNNDLEFKDNTLDGIYEIQAMTFANDLTKTLKEFYRVLKPGKRVVFIDGVPLDNCDIKHTDDIMKYWDVRGVTAGGGFWHPKYWEKSAKDAGFNVILSTCGDKHDHHYANEAPVLIDIDAHYHRIKDVIYHAANIGLIPDKLHRLFHRLCLGSKSLIELAKEDKLTTNYIFVFEKPLDVDEPVSQAPSQKISSPSSSSSSSSCHDLAEEEDCQSSDEHSYAVPKTENPRSSESHAPCSA